MTQKAIIQLIIVLAVVSLLAMITGCSSKENDKGSDDTGTINNDCCQECLDYANKDPSGYDISIKPCSAYGLSCDQRVGDCRNEDEY